MDNPFDPFAPLSPAELAQGAREIAGGARKSDAIPVCPPSDAEPGALAAERLYGRKPDGLWRYATAQDDTAFYAARWNEADGKKTFRPISWRDGESWQFAAWPKSSALIQIVRSRFET